METGFDEAARVVRVEIPFRLLHRSPVTLPLSPCHCVHGGSDRGLQLLRWWIAPMVLVSCIAAAEEGLVCMGDLLCLPGEELLLLEADPTPRPKWPADAAMGDSLTFKAKLSKALSIHSYTYGTELV